MTSKEYLNQAYRLEQRIRLHKERLDELRDLAGSPGSPGFEAHYNPNKPTEAPFVKTLHKILELEEKVNAELQLLLKLQAEIQETIDALYDVDERLVLTYRYLKNMSWSQIGDRLYVDERTVRRWHNRALSHIKVPSEPTVL